MRKLLTWQWMSFSWITVSSWMEQFSIMIRLQQNVDIMDLMEYLKGWGLNWKFETTLSGWAPLVLLQEALSYAFVNLVIDRREREGIKGEAWSRQRKERSNKGWNGSRSQWIPRSFLLVRFSAAICNAVYFPCSSFIWTLNIFSHSNSCSKSSDNFGFRHLILLGMLLVPRCIAWICHLVRKVKATLWEASSRRR